jgi:hypothetical protein
VILDVEATPAHRTAEVESTKVMVERVEERFDLRPPRLIADTAYGTAPMPGWIVEEKAIEPHVPYFARLDAANGKVGAALTLNLYASRRAATYWREGGMTTGSSIRKKRRMLT